MLPETRRTKLQSSFRWNSSLGRMLLLVTTLFCFKNTLRLQKTLLNAQANHNIEGDAGQKGTVRCQVTPRFLPLKQIDTAGLQGEMPEHVRDFDRKGYTLPRYPSSEIMMVSVTSNATYGRRIAQENTIGRIFQIEYLSPSDLPECVLCEQADQEDTCHCPSFRSSCYKDTFFEKSAGWWCAQRRELFALKVAIEKLGGGELPKWAHVMEDQTFVNPIGEMLFLRELDPDVPYWIGDDWGGFLGHGCGKLASRGLLKLLAAPPVNPTVLHRWPDGTRALVPETQIDSCFDRYQGGDWCYYHGDWAASACVKEVGVNLTDLGLVRHLGFFSHHMQSPLEGSTSPWFEIENVDIARSVHRTHSIALHVSIEDMYDLFYNTIVPQYQRFYEFT